MYFCYLDDSGDSKNGVTITALLIEDRSWTTVLNAWLQGRREVHQEFGVLKKSEVHANALFKGRGSYCESKAENARFGTGQRAATGRILLTRLSEAPFTVVTLGTADVSKPRAYARAIAWLEDWATRHDTYLVIFYDGQQGLAGPEENPTADQRQELWERAIRDAHPYRQAHRNLDINVRRILEDPVMQDSRFSQLIQAADLLAYGAYHRHHQDHPEIWGTSSQTVRAAIVAYMKVSAHWPEGTDYGVVWLDS
ncbi:hypothetical protein BG28_09815 [Nesterenkonia sp. AN1]|uniref:DUF3800 domain-containing protein n=1 Tax=Nesterenkonia sp. AN1 TaxID=652017 RepID=UPI000447A518|nr:DUF3800 domain-containing protein [Nesterenkonia sp. AN1]EXF23872.1 hypothetical protein BG28_09815 [Nesterenkonia sp. AN1]